MMVVEVVEVLEVWRTGESVVEDVAHLEVSPTYYC